MLKIDTSRLKILFNLLDNFQRHYNFIQFVYGRINKFKVFFYYIEGWEEADTKKALQIREIITKYITNIFLIKS